MTKLEELKIVRQSKRDERNITVDCAQREELSIEISRMSEQIRRIETGSEYCNRRAS
jgi:hypothetical protein